MWDEKDALLAAVQLRAVELVPDFFSWENVCAVLPALTSYY